MSNCFFTTSFKIIQWFHKQIFLCYFKWIWRWCIFLERPLVILFLNSLKSLLKSRHTNGNEFMSYLKTKFFRRLPEWCLVWGRRKAKVDGSFPIFYDGILSYQIGCGNKGITFLKSILAKFLITSLEFYYQLNPKSLRPTKPETWKMIYAEQKENWRWYFCGKLCYSFIQLYCFLWLNKDLNIQIFDASLDLFQFYSKYKQLNTQRTFSSSVLVMLISLSLQSAFSVLTWRSLSPSASFWVQTNYGNNSSSNYIVFLKMLKYIQYNFENKRNACCESRENT